MSEIATWLTEDKTFHDIIFKIHFALQFMFPVYVTITM